MEMWRTVYEFPQYEISSSGRCLNAYTGKVLKSHLQADRWVIYILFRRGARFERQAGRLVASAFIRDPLPGEIVKHKDGDLLNNNVENLEWTFRRDYPQAFKHDNHTKYLLVEELGRVFNSYAELSRFFDLPEEKVFQRKKVRGYTITGLY